MKWTLPTLETTTEKKIWKESIKTYEIIEDDDDDDEKQSK